MHQYILELFSLYVCLVEKLQPEYDVVGHTRFVLEEFVLLCRCMQS